MPIYNGIPTEPGWYFARPKNEKTPIECVKVTRSEIAGLLAWRVGYSAVYSETLDWFGKVPMPVEAD
jgi:hypothetical protein